MKPTLLFMAAIFLAISVTGQSVNKKTTANPHKKPRGFESFHRFSAGAEKNDIPRFIQYHSPEANRLKSAWADKQKLDSTIGQFWYTDAGRWIDEYKEEFTYDAGGNMTAYIYYDADTINNRWVTDDKQEYSYDASGNNTVYLFAEWDMSTGEWIPSDKNENTFDANDRNTQTLTSSWDETTGQWEAGQKWEFAYNAGGNMTLQLAFYPDELPGEWYAYAKDTLIYDAQGNSTGNIHSFWDDVDSIWLFFQKNEYIYDAAGNQTGSVYYYWMEDAGYWVASYKEEYAYDAGGKWILYTDYNWDDTDSLWIADYKEEFNYDANGNLTHFFDYEWNADSAKWISDYKGEITYNNAFSGSDLIIPYFYAEESGIFFNHMLTGFQSDYWDADLGQFVNAEKIAFYYSGGGSNTYVAEIDGAGIKVYPNPVSGFLSFDVSGNADHFMFELFDVQGRKILSAVLQNGEKLNMRGLSNGIYFYNLSADGIKQSGKLIKE